MKLNKTYVGLGVLVLLIGIVAFYAGKNSQGETADTTTASTTDTFTETSTTSGATTGGTKGTTGTVLVSGNTTGYSTYSNSVYNFTLKYPTYVQARQSFSTFHEIGNNWRVNAAPANQGKGLAEFSIFSIDQGSYSTGKQTYPLYFTAEVRVGVSPNTKECYTPDAGYTNQKVTNVTINGVAFKKFSSSEGGMMKYNQIESYRTIRNNTCFVLEQIKSGSSYRDELMKPGISDTTLNNYFATGETIIKTLRFTK